MPITAPTLAVADLANSGGFNATLTGGDAGATNTLYYASVTGNLETLTMVVAGSRTGPGAIIGTLSKGYRLWQVRSVLGSESVPSDVVYQRLSDGRDALHQEIIDAVEARAVLLDMDDLENVEQLRVLDPPRVAKIKAVPALVLTTFTLLETFPGGTNQRDDVGFPVNATFIDNHPLDDERQGRMLKWRQQLIRACISQRLDGVTEEMTCTVEPGPIVATIPQIDAYCFSGLVLRFTCRTPRGLGA